MNEKNKRSGNHKKESNQSEKMRSGKKSYLTSMLLDHLNASRRNHSVIGLSLQIVQTYMQWQTNKISAEARTPTKFFFTISGS
jgi:hypothetical protein